MALDRSLLGTIAAEQMEALDNDYGNDESVHIGAVVTIVEVLRDQGEGRVESMVRARHNTGDPYRAIGVLQQAAYNIAAGRRPNDEP